MDRRTGAKGRTRKSTDSSDFEALEHTKGHGGDEEARIPKHEGPLAAAALPERKQKAQWATFWIEFDNSHTPPPDTICRWR